MGFEPMRKETFFGLRVRPNRPTLATALKLNLERQVGFEPTWGETPCGLKAHYIRPLYHCPL